jgi:hypothetical protein
LETREPLKSSPGRDPFREPPPTVGATVEERRFSAAQAIKREAGFSPGGNREVHEFHSGRSNGKHGTGFSR